MGDQDRSNDAAKAENAASPKSPDELMAAIDARLKDIETKIGRVSAKPQAFDGTWPSAIATVVNSGLFFMTIGGGLLYLAEAKMVTNHAGITFILVVLGVALVLYGTGTQGGGSFNGNLGYNVAVAGGAGGVAFAVAAGIIYYSPEMRNAFQPERKFVRISVDGGVGMTDIAKYASTFELDGYPIPSVPSGTSNSSKAFVYVPYLSFDIPKTKKSNSPKTEKTKPNSDDNEPADDGTTEENDKGMCGTKENQEALHQLDHNAPHKMVTARFHQVQQSPNEVPPQDLLVRLDEHIFNNHDGGVEFPLYPVTFCVHLQDSSPDIASNAQADHTKVTSAQSLRPIPAAPTGGQ